VAACLDAYFERPDGGAGRAGADFLTSPEVGSLFGALVARALDRWWDELGRPDPFLVIEGGAGRGRLARDVLRAAPACAPAMRYVLVERSRLLRAEPCDGLRVEPWEDALGPFSATGDPGDVGPVDRTGPIVTSLTELPTLPFDGVVLANELLDNLPFDLLERTDRGWDEVRVGVTDDRFVEVVVPAPESVAPAFDAPPGARLPYQRAVETWLAAAGAAVRAGVLAVIDYVAPAAVLAARGQAGWLRTYRGHRRGVSALEVPGTQDVTADVVLETLRRGARHGGWQVRAETTQAAWLTGLGVDDLATEGRRAWRARAALGDLDALAARSRVSEAAALTDPAGLGAHTVAIFTKRGDRAART
jgi:SAM-dependent MidA family methyltransferase